MKEFAEWNDYYYLSKEEAKPCMDILENIAKVLSFVDHFSLQIILTYICFFISLVLRTKKMASDEEISNIEIGSLLSDLETKCEKAFAIEKVYRTILLCTHDKMLRAVVLPKLNSKLDDKKAQSFRNRIRTSGKKQQSQTQQNENNQPGDSSQEE